MLDASNPSAVRFRHKRSNHRRQLDVGTFTGDGTTDSSGNDALNQLLSSQAAQYSATAFSDQGSATDAILPNAIPSTTESTFSTSVKTSTTSSAAPTATPSTTSSALTTLSSVSIGPTATAASASNTSTSKPSHAAAIGVTVTFFIVMFIVAVFHLIRRRQVRKRQERRTTWNPPVFINDADMATSPVSLEDGADGHFETIDINEGRGPVPLPDSITYETMSSVSNIPLILPIQPPPLHPTGYAPPRMPSPPPIAVGTVDYSRETPTPVGINAPSLSGGPAPLVSSTQFAPIAPATPTPPRISTVSNGSSAGSAFGAQIQTGTLVIVARTFVPTLPDELSIQTGEQVRIVNRYDDGWAHVERMKSGAGIESGVVPLECLDSYLSGPDRLVTAGGLAQVAVEGWRLSKRNSSLRPVDSPRF